MKVLLQCRDNVFWASDGLVRGLERVQAYSDFSGLAGVGSLSRITMLDIQSVGCDTRISWPVVS